MIEAYLDESGIHEGAKVCAIAGYFGEQDNWRGFETDWRKLLDLFDVPLNKFHAKNIIKRRGFFSDWKNQKHETFLSSISDVILRHKIHPLLAGVIVDDFNSLSLPARKFFTGARLHESGQFLTTGCPNKPYFMPFQYCLRKICGYAPENGKVHFFFGLDRTFSEYAVSLFSFIKENVEMPNKDRLGNPSFPMAKETPELQAADYLVYSCYLHMLERNETGDWKSPPGRRLNALAQRVRNRDDLVFFNTECLRGMLERDKVPIPAEI